MQNKRSTLATVNWSLFFSPCYNRSTCRVPALSSKTLSRSVRYPRGLVPADHCTGTAARICGAVRLVYGTLPLSRFEGVYIEAGLLHLERLATANSEQHTALIPLMVGVVARACGAEKHVEKFNDYRMIMRLPFVIVGMLLGASLWYVARRLFGNLGGYIALLLYAFSPMAIGKSSEIGPFIVGAWGAFGLIYTGIAVAHTLYAPREVVLWKLASHPSDGTLDRHLCGCAIFVLGSAATGVSVHVMGGMGEAGGGCRHFRRRMLRCPRSPLGAFWFSHCRLCPGTTACGLARSSVARLRRAWTFLAVLGPVSGQRARVAPASRHFFGGFRCLEANAIFWYGGPSDRFPATVQPVAGHAVFRGVLRFSWPPVHDAVYCRGFDRPAGEQIRADLQRCHFWGPDCQRHDRRLQPRVSRFSNPLRTLRHRKGWNTLRALCRPGAIP